MVRFLAGIAAVALVVSALTLATPEAVVVPETQPLAVVVSR